MQLLDLQYSWKNIVYESLESLLTKRKVLDTYLKKMPIPSGSFQLAFYELWTAVTYRLTFNPALINTMPYFHKLIAALTISGYLVLITLFLRVLSYRKKNYLVLKGTCIIELLIRSLWNSLQIRVISFVFKTWKWKKYYKSYFRNHNWI